MRTKVLLLRWVNVASLMFANISVATLAVLGALFWRCVVLFSQCKQTASN